MGGVVCCELGVGCCLKRLKDKGEGRRSEVGWGEGRGMRDDGRGTKKGGGRRKAQCIEV